MRNKFVAAFAALALAVTSLLAATSASAIQGDDPRNPIILASPNDVPAGAVSTGSRMRQCATVQTWALTIPGDNLIEHPEYRYLREVPAVEEVSHLEYRWSLAARTYNPGQPQVTHQVYSYERVVPDYVTYYQYQEQVQGNLQRYAPDWLGNWSWINVGTFGWEWWNSYTIEWSYMNFDVLYAGPHSAVQAQWTESGYQYRKLTTAYQFVKNGYTQQVQVGAHTAYSGEVTSPLDAPWVPRSGYPVTVIDQPYIAPSFTPWVWNSYTSWQISTTPPADPDGQNDPNNPANLWMIAEGGPVVHETRVITTPAVAAYTEYYVYGGPPSLIEADASWVSATQSPSGWVRFNTRVVVDQPATPDIVTYYEYSDGVQCSVQITDNTVCGEFDVTVSHNTRWRYGVTVEFDGADMADMGDSVVVVGPGTETLSFEFDEDEFGGEVTGRYYVTDATEWRYVPTDLQVARPYGSNIGTAFREFTVNTDCAPNYNPGSPSVAVVQTCGEVELTFTNDVVLGDNEYAEPASFSYTDADGVTRNVIVEPNGMPVVVTVSFPEDSNPQQVTYWEPTGDPDGTTLDVETNCQPDPVTVDFDFAVTPPTRTADGSLPVLPADGSLVGYSLAWDRAFDGPGTYTLTATADTGYVIEGQTSKDFTVEPMLATPATPPTLATTGFDTVGVMSGMIGILGLGIMVLAGAARLRRSRQEG